MARPSSMTPAIVAAIVKAKELGSGDVIAAAAGGVPVRTLYTWLSRGRALAERTNREKPLTANEQLAEAFAQAYQAAVHRHALAQREAYLQSLKFRDMPVAV